MSALYNEYLSGLDREIAIIIAESNAQFAKIDVLFNAVDATLEANMLAAEAKVFAENGTYDDLTMLYKEAVEDANKKNVGVFAAIFAAIKKFFTNIGEFIKKTFGKNKDNIPESANVPEDFEENMNIFQRIWNQIKSAVELFKSGDIKGGCLKILGLFSIDKLGLPAAIGAATTVVVVKRDKLKSWLNILDTAQEEVTNATTAAEAAINNGSAKLEVVASVVDAATGNTSDGQSKSLGEKITDFTKDKANKAIAILKKIGSWILSALSRLGQWMRGTFNKIADKVNAKNEDNDQSSENNNTSKPDEQKDETKTEVKSDEKSADPEMEKKLAAIKLTKEEINAAIDAKKKELKAKSLTKEGKQDAIREAKLAKYKKRNSALDTWNEEDVNFESTSLFGVELDSDDMFYESEMSEEDYNELCELFAEL